MKKILSFLFAAALCCTAVISLAGCGDGNYPVSVANITIDKEPENIVVLDPSAADIISYMSYDRKIVGRSNDVDQSYLAVAPSFGSAVAPDVNGIINSGAEIVFAGDALDETIKKALEDEDIIVVKISLANSPKELETNYTTISKILGGAIDGEAKGVTSYSKLIDSMEDIKFEADAANTTAALDTSCYLYSENAMLKQASGGTYGDMLLGYTGTVNVAVNIENDMVDFNTLKVANPNYIFYDDDATLETIKANPTLSKLSAIKSGKVLKITNAEMTRQGLTALETLQKMINFIHPELADKATSDEAAQTLATQASQTETQTQQETQPATEEAKSVSVADKYDIDLKDLSLKYEDENDDVKAMQQRLYDLGYVDDKENITGYYGDISKKAVQDFQKNNGIKETGKADNKTLTAMFMDNAIKAKASE